MSNTKPKHTHIYTHLRHEDDHIVDWETSEPFFAEVDIFVCTTCLEYQTKIIRDTSEMVVQRTTLRLKERKKARKFF